MKKRGLKTLLRDTRVELTAGRKLLAEKSKARKKAKTKAARKNAALAAACVEDAIESIEHHRDLLEREAERQSDSGSHPGG